MPGENSQSTDYRSVQTIKDAEECTVTKHSSKGKEVYSWQCKQADIDSYNKPVNEINNAGKEYNRVNNEVNAGRTEILTIWSVTEKNFMDNHMPYAR